MSSSCFAVSPLQMPVPSSAQTAVDALSRQSMRPLWPGPIVSFAFIFATSWRCRSTRLCASALIFSYLPCAGGVRSVHRFTVYIGEMTG